MVPSILPIRAPHRPASELIRFGLARLGIALPRPSPVAGGAADPTRWRPSGSGTLPAALGGSDADLARLARGDATSPIDRVRWNAIAPFYGGRPLRG